MNIYNFIGIIILALPFVLLACYLYYLGGITPVLIVFGGSGLLIGSIFLGVHLFFIP